MLVAVRIVQVWKGELDNVQLAPDEDWGRLTQDEVKRRSDQSQPRYYEPYSDVYVSDMAMALWDASVSMNIGPLVLSQRVLTGPEDEFEDAVDKATGIIKSVRYPPYKSRIRCCICVASAETDLVCSRSSAPTAGMPMDGLTKSVREWNTATSRRPGWCCQYSTGYRQGERDRLMSCMLCCILVLCNYLKLNRDYDYKSFYVNGML